MTLVIAIFILLLSLLAWIGQVISTVSPRMAVQLRLTEKEGEVDPTFYADGRAECIWDALCLWILPVAAILHIADQAVWPLFGLVGGGMYLYFAGRGIAQRILMQRLGMSVGEAKNVKLFYLFLGLWGVAGFVEIFMASFELLGR